MGTGHQQRLACILQTIASPRPIVAEQGCAADRLQRPLLRRSRFQRRLTPGVRLQMEFFDAS
jgi:hypothetical protein